MARKAVIKNGITRARLAEIYECDISIIVQWLKQVGVDHQKNLSPRELTKFVLHTGIPHKNVEVQIPFLTIQVLEQIPLQFGQVA